MNSLILCEGKTDCILLQYYLEKVCKWERIGKSGFHAVDKAWSNQFKKDNNSLIISETKGCSRICEGLHSALLRNMNVAPGGDKEYFDKILIFSDNDEVDTPENVMAKIEMELKEMLVSYVGPITKCSWNHGRVQTIEGERNVDIYLMFIPFSKNGALETYLLSCIGENDCYDQAIIDNIEVFVNSVDEEKRYLHNRRIITKANFDVYFSIRTAVDQYAERQSILKSIKWEEYPSMRKDFSVFSDLG